MLLLAAAIVGLILSSKTREGDIIGGMGYNVMQFSRRADFPQLAPAADLTKAIGSDNEAKLIAYLITYDETLEERALTENGLTATADERLRDDINRRLSEANHFGRTISPILQSERLFVREFQRPGDLPHLHAVVIRESGRVLLQILLITFDEVEAPKARIQE